jgi:hypothetical protein
LAGLGTVGAPNCGPVVSAVPQASLGIGELNSPNLMRLSYCSILTQNLEVYSFFMGQRLEWRKSGRYPVFRSPPPHSAK